VARSGSRRFGGAPPACQRSGRSRIAWENNTKSGVRFRGRKVPERSHPLAPDSRRWRAVGRRALRAMGNINRRLRWVEPGRRSGATVATDPAGLSDTGTVECFQPARAAVDRGRWREASNGGLNHWRLATFPFHIFGLLTHRWRCSESSWRKFWKNFA